VAVTLEPYNSLNPNIQLWTIARNNSVYTFKNVATQMYFFTMNGRVTQSLSQKMTSSALRDRSSTSTAQLSRRRLECFRNRLLHRQHASRRPRRCEGRGHNRRANGLEEHFSLGQHQP
jgi:hypothetical protein